MSWIEQISNDLIITTGDGKEYRPNWMNASKQVEYHISEFDFINKGGTLVKRQKHRGSKYQLELYFQGDDHLDVAREFELSSQDSRAWTMLHPFYGSILVQPTSLLFDNTGYNITLIKGVVIETIGQVLPQTTVAPADQISYDKSQLDEAVAQSFSNSVTPDTADINSMTANNDDLYNSGQKIAKSSSQDYLNKYIAANSAVLSATAEPLAAMRKIQALINAPAQFEESIQNRMNLLLDQFNLLRTKLENITRKSDKIIYESTLGSLVSSMALAVSTGIYGNKNEVITQVENLLNSYNNYLSDLDSVSSSTAGSLTSYFPDAQNQISLNNLINFTASNLFDIAVDSRSEYTLLLEEDSNLIELTHRLYGISEESITELIDANSIALSEYLVIKKGRPITYYQ